MHESGSVTAEQQDRQAGQTQQNQDTLQTDLAARTAPQIGGIPTDETIYGGTADAPPGYTTVNAEQQPDGSYRFEYQRTEDYLAAGATHDAASTAGALLDRNTNSAVAAYKEASQFADNLNAETAQRQREVDQLAPRDLSDLPSYQAGVDRADVLAAGGMHAAGLDLGVFQSRFNPDLTWPPGASVGPDDNYFRTNSLGRFLATSLGDPAAVLAAPFRVDGETVNPLSDTYLNPLEIQNGKFALLTSVLPGAVGLMRDTGALPETIAVYRKMSAAEAATTLDTLELQPPIGGSNSSKYLSESLAKVEAFQNRGVPADTAQEILEFTLGQNGYSELMSSAVNQVGSRGIDAIKYNYEGILDPNVRNIGVPESQLDQFNALILSIRKLGGQP